MLPSYRRKVHSLLGHGTGTVVSAFNSRGAAYLLLEQQHAIQERFRGWRTSRHINVDRDDTVAAADYRIGIMIVAAAIGAGPHGNHIAGLGHLVVNLAPRRGHFVGERARDDHHVRLTRRCARSKTETLDIVPRHRHLHHLDRATGKPELHPHQRTGARPGNKVVGGGYEEALVGEFSIDLREKRVAATCGLLSRSDQCGFAQSHSSFPSDTELPDLNAVHK